MNYSYFHQTTPRFVIYCVLSIILLDKIYTLLSSINDIKTNGISFVINALSYIISYHGTNPSIIKNNILPNTFKYLLKRRETTIHLDVSYHRVDIRSQVGCRKFDKLFESTCHVSQFQQEQRQILSQKYQLITGPNIHK